MPYTTVTTGQVLTASFLNTNYRDQVISTVTSSTRPAGTEGQMIYETDTNLLLIYSGTAWIELGRWGTWTAWTPDYTYGGAARTPTSPSGRYIRHGSMVTIVFTMLAQSTESGSSVRVTNLPITPLSGGIRTWGWCRTAAATTGVLVMDMASGNIEVLTNVLGAPALTAGAEIGGSITYET